MVNHKLQNEIEGLKKRAAVHYILNEKTGLVNLYVANEPEGVS